MRWLLAVPGDPVALYADTALSREVLGWTARRGLDEMLASAWAWHSMHLDGYGESYALGPEGTGGHWRTAGASGAPA